VFSISTTCRGTAALFDGFQRHNPRKKNRIFPLTRKPSFGNFYLYLGKQVCNESQELMRKNLGIFFGLPRLGVGAALVALFAFTSASRAGLLYEMTLTDVQGAGVASATAILGVEVINAGVNNRGQLLEHLWWNRATSTKFNLAEWEFRIRQLGGYQCTRFRSFFISHRRFIVHRSQWR
jgi:hypothetical protein